MVQPLYIGNAIRLFLEPPAGATEWKVLRKGSNTFTGHDDGAALLAYRGADRVIDDITGLQNEVLQFYCPFYTSDGGATWTAGAVASGTARATYEEQTTDVLDKLRERLEAGLLIEVQRGNFMTDLGYVQVYTAAPSLERDLRMPLVTLHLEDESPAERGIGESVAQDEFNAIGYDWDDSEGYIANVSVVVVGWSLNSDERIELRKAIRRIIVGNFPVFEGLGWALPSLRQQDNDAINGEFPAQIYQVISTFSCLAPVRVGGRALAVRTIDIGVNENE